MGSRPRLRAAAASRLVGTRHLAHGRIISGTALAAVCCRRFVLSAFVVFAFRILQAVSMGSRPRLRAAAASRLDCVGHWHPLCGANNIPQAGTVSGKALAAGSSGVSRPAGCFHGLTPTATCCRRFAAGLRFVVSAFRVLQSAFRDVGVSCHAGWFHGLTPTATCCRRFAAGLSWACRTPRGWSAPDISTTAAWLAALRLPPLRSALRAVGASCSRHFACRRFVPRFVQSALRTVGLRAVGASLCLFLLRRPGPSVDSSRRCYVAGFQTSVSRWVKLGP